MPLTSGSSLSASDFKDLKARIKSLMNKRTGSPNLQSYAGTAYDYTTTPSTNVPVRQEHYEKITEPMRAIKDISELPPSELSDPTIQLQGMADELGVYEKNSNSVSVRTSNSRVDCGSACAGLCYDTCTGGCRSSCFGGCVGCGDNCSRSCGDDCAQDGCSDNCGTSCGDQCDQDGCSDNCARDCGQGCNADGCTGNCGQNCTKDCASECSTPECSGSCGWDCSDNCVGECWSQCGNECTQDGCTSSCGQDNCSKNCAGWDQALL